MRVVRFAIDPRGAPRQTGRDAWDPSLAVQRYRVFRDELRILADLAGYVPGEVLVVTFHLPMPASWSGRKRARMNGTKHQSKPDTDNLLKAFLDALVTDDAYVWDLHGRKLWAAQGAIVVEESPCRS